MLQEERQALSGESWTQGQVVISWEDALEGAAVVDDGRNVVIHEFAHVLDMGDGAADGIPPLADRVEREAWAAVIDAEFNGFCDRVDAPASIRDLPLTLRRAGTG